MNKKNLAFDTLNAIDLFTDNDQQVSFTKDMLIMHIPHSSTYIPDYGGYTSRELLEAEIKLTTDFHSEKIFHINGVTDHITPFSRVYCDVERLPNSIEPLFKKGRGYYYTHTDDGNLFRNGSAVANVYENYMHHHSELKRLVDYKLSKFGKAVIIDCHSFPDTPLKTDLIQNTNRPDICIGINDYHTPKQLLIDFVNYFESLGYGVMINTPHDNTIIPLDYLNNNKNVIGIMIEINRKLYMKEDTYETYLAVEELNVQINKLFNNLSIDL